MGGDNTSFSSLENIDTTIALILKELQGLESKLDFAFLESLACRIEYSEVSHQSIARSATESRPLRGAEIVDLPSGSRVYPHDRSLLMARQMGYSQGLGINQAGRNKDMKVNVTVNMGGVTVNESKGDIDSLTKQIVQNICYEMQKQAVNMNVGAI